MIALRLGKGSDTTSADSPLGLMTAEFLGELEQLESYQSLASADPFADPHDSEVVVEFASSGADQDCPAEVSPTAIGNAPGARVAIVPEAVLPPDQDVLDAHSACRHWLDFVASQAVKAAHMTRVEDDFMPRDTYARVTAMRMREQAPLAGDLLASAVDAIEQSRHMEPHELTTRLGKAVDDLVADFAVGRRVDAVLDRWPEFGSERGVLSLQEIVRDNPKIGSLTSPQTVAFAVAETANETLGRAALTSRDLLAEEVPPALNASEATKAADVVEMGLARTSLALNKALADAHTRNLTCDIQTEEAWTGPSVTVTVNGENVLESPSLYDPQGPNRLIVTSALALNQHLSRIRETGADVSVHIQRSFKGPPRVHLATPEPTFGPDGPKVF